MTSIAKTLKNKLLIGWNEWCALPDLHLPAIKAKIDTGAKTSALHAFNIETYKLRGNKFVRFEMHPLQHNDKLIINCRAKVVDERFVMSSNGHRERRYVIKTPLMIGDKKWDIEVTLSNRDPLTYRMLLGREALNGHVIINPKSSLKLGKITKSQLNDFYKINK